MGFFKELDTEENLMGVGNGILKFVDDDGKKRPVLVSTYHHHKISRHSNVEYKEFDINNNTTKMVIQIHM